MSYTTRTYPPMPAVLEENAYDALSRFRYSKMFKRLAQYGLTVEEQRIGAAHSEGIDGYYEILLHNALLVAAGYVILEA